MKLMDNGCLFLDESPGLVAQEKTQVENGSSGVDTLSKIMERMKEERKSQVRLSKHCKVRFRKNSLWDKKQRNGKVVCIDQKNYKNTG
jgi:hypothetical protein